MLSILTLSRRHKTCIILLWLTPDDFTRQGESSRLERIISRFIKIFGQLPTLHVYDLQQRPRKRQRLPWNKWLVAVYFWMPLNSYNIVGSHLRGKHILSFMSYICYSIMAQCSSKSIVLYYRKNFTCRNVSSSQRENLERKQPCRAVFSPPWPTHL